VKDLSASEEDFKKQVLSDKIERKLQDKLLLEVLSEPPGLIRPDKISSARDQMSPSKSE
jgi:hypothetical protein